MGLERGLNASFGVCTLTPRTIRDLMQENEDRDIYFTKIPQVAGGGTKCYCRGKEQYAKGGEVENHIRGNLGEELGLCQCWGGERRRVGSP